VEEAVDEELIKWWGADHNKKDGDYGGSK